MNDPVIEANALPTLPSLRLLDARSQDAFDQQHAEHAVRVPIEKWISAAQQQDGALENTAYWEAEINALGVCQDSLAVVYDDGRMIDAARVWFILQHFGAQAAIVNGGWPAMAGISLSATAAESGKRFHAQAAAGKVGLIDRHRLKAELGGVRIFDARTAAEFTGEDLKRNARGGHLPGARLLPHAALMKDNRLLPPDALRDLLTKAGFDEGDHIVTHCDGGGRAALAAIAAVRAGYSDVHAYYLSFADWAKDESCPIVKP